MPLIMRLGIIMSLDQLLPGINFYVVLDLYSYLYDLYSYSYNNYLTRTLFVIHSAMVLISVPVGPSPCYDSDVVCIFSFKTSCISCL